MGKTHFVHSTHGYVGRLCSTKINRQYKVTRIKSEVTCLKCLKILEKVNE